MRRRAQDPFKTAKSSRGRTHARATSSIPTERIRGHIDELFAQDKGLTEISENVARLGAQLLRQAAVEAEITEFLGRDRYPAAGPGPGPPPDQDRARQPRYGAPATADFAQSSGEPQGP